MKNKIVHGKIEHKLEDFYEKPKVDLSMFVCDIVEYIKTVDWDEIDKIDERELWDAEDTHYKPNLNNNNIDSDWDFD